MNTKAFFLIIFFAQMSTSFLMSMDRSSFNKRVNDLYQEIKNLRIRSNLIESGMTHEDAAREADRQVGISNTRGFDAKPIDNRVFETWYELNMRPAGPYIYVTKLNNLNQTSEDLRKKDRHNIINSHNIINKNNRVFGLQCNLSNYARTINKRQEA